MSASVARQARGSTRLGPAHQDIAEGLEIAPLRRPATGLSPRSCVRNRP